MNKCAIYHRSESNYCFALDNKTIALRIRFEKGEKIKKISVVYNTKYDISKKQFRKELEYLCSDGLYDYYGTIINLKDSRFAYVFEIDDYNKIYYYCEVGVKDSYDFNLAYYDSFQYAYINDNDIIQNVKWLNHAVFYQIFVERFAKGSLKDESYINANWSDKPTPKSFYGGDLDGIRNHIPYIKSLGVTAIYLTPIFKSISNHKYDISDYYHVDEMFGGNDALKRLVDSCHKEGIKIILDAVFNHVSEKFEPFKDVIQFGDKSKYFHWFYIKGNQINHEKNNYECFASCEYMPKLNTNNLEVQTYLIDIIKYWMEEFKIDGWRLDVADEVSHDFWRKLRKEVKKINKEAVLIGENWHNSESYLLGDQFDSIMNYGMTKAMLDYWSTECLDEKELANAMNGQLMRYTDTTNHMMFNLLDCHDTYRFLTEVNGNPDKLICALAMMVFLPGSVNLYYGTEILTEGGFDPDSRRTFDFSRIEDERYRKYIKIVTSLLELKQQPALIDGTIKVYEEDGMFVIKRKSEKQTLTLYVTKKKRKINRNLAMKYNVTDVMQENSFIIEGELI